MRRPPAIVAALCLAIACAAGFLGLASEVFEKETVSFDRVLLLALRAPGNLADPIGPPWLEESMRDLTALGGSTVLVLIVVSTIVFLYLAHRPRAAALLATVVAAGFIVTNILKHIYARERPDLVPHAVLTASASFPSGHAMMSALVYLTLGTLLAHIHDDRRIKAFVLVLGVGLAVLIGTSRVYLGVHWPTDVVAGWALGAAWAAGSWAAAVWLQGKGLIEGASASR